MYSATWEYEAKNMFDDLETVVLGRIWEGEAGCLAP